MARAIEAEPADAPLPETTPEALAARIEAAWKDHEASLLKVEFDEERDDFLPGSAQKEGVKPPRLKFPGRFQKVIDGVRCYLAGSRRFATDKAG